MVSIMIIATSRRGLLRAIKYNCSASRLTTRSLLVILFEKLDSTDRIFHKIISSDEIVDQ